MLEELRKELSSFNTFDLLKRVGALHLIPRNASRAFSLDAFAHLVSAQEYRPNDPVISQTRFKNLVRQHLGGSSPMGQHDDPFPQMFTEEIPFHYGPYKIFPGPTAGDQDILRWLLKAADMLCNTDVTGSFCKEIRAAATLCLSVSNSIAFKAGLKRGQQPLGNRVDDIEVRDARSMKSGAAAITFSLEEIERMLRHDNQFLKALAPFCTKPGTNDWDSYSTKMGWLHHRPFVKMGKSLLVPNPSLFVTALRQRIICIAMEYGVLDALADTYREVVWIDIEESLGFQWSYPISLPLPASSPTGFKEGIFYLDIDKLMYVQLVSDNLQDFTGDFKTGLEGTNQSETRVAGRVTEMVSYLKNLDPTPEKVLVLTIIQPAGREMVVELGQAPADSLWLNMNAGDLRTITLGSEDPLELWKFARSQQRNLEKTEVMGIDSLDEYVLYRSSKRSFYVTDEPPPDLLLFEPGSGPDFRRKVSQERDFHVVPSLEAGQLTEVILLHGADVPISISRGYSGDQDSLVVEGQLPMPVWVVGPNKYR